MEVLIVIIIIALFVRIIEVLWKRSAKRDKQRIEERRKAEEERRKAEEERRKAEEERRKAEEERRKESEEEQKWADERCQIEQWILRYKNSPYVQKLAEIFAEDFISAILNINYDIHNRYIRILVSRRAYYTIFQEYSHRYFYDPVVECLDFYKENLKPFDSEFQLRGFMGAIGEVAKEIAMRKYAIKCPSSARKEEYTIDSSFPLVRIVNWDNDEGRWDEDDRLNGYGWWSYCCRIDLSYSTLNPYYESPTDLI